jgi:hypothetical protein
MRRRDPVQRPGITTLERATSNNDDPARFWDGLRATTDQPEDLSTGCPDRIKPFPTLVPSGRAIRNPFYCKVPAVVARA